jgi:MerR family transcriptional regulator, copper efflux regulator
MTDDERVKIITKLLIYKKSLEENHEKLLDELLNYYNQDDELLESDGIDSIRSGLKDLNNVSYENAYEAYLISQIKLSESLPPVIKQHIHSLNVGDDIDIVLESMEMDIYILKKDIYIDMKEWEVVLDHVSDERLSEIENNPKGHGDLILKELSWIKKFEDKLLKKGF